MQRGGQPATRKPGEKRPLTSENDEMRRIRRANLKIVAEERGGVTSLAKRLGYATSSYVSQLCGGQRPIREETARYVEKSLGLPSKWLDTRHDDLARGPKLDESLVMQAFDAVSLAVQKFKLDISVGTQKRLVELVYENAQRSGHIDDAYVRKVVDLLK